MLRKEKVLLGTLPNNVSDIPSLNKMEENGFKNNQSFKFIGKLSSNLLVVNLIFHTSLLNCRILLLKGPLEGICPIPHSFYNKEPESCTGEVISTGFL